MSPGDLTFVEVSEAMRHGRGRDLMMGAGLAHLKLAGKRTSSGVIHSATILIVKRYAAKDPCRAVFGDG